MCCETKFVRVSRASDCCCGPGHMSRRFVSSEEEADKLACYKKQLEKEIAGIDERIEELKKK